MTSDEKKQSFWTTHSGILTGIAAIITAIGGLYLAIGDGSKGNEVESLTFEYPMLDGYRLDYCHTWAQDCSQKAADAWCIEKGFSKASHFVQDGTDGLVTKTIGSHQICNEPVKCYSFSSITWLK